MLELARVDDDREAIVFSHARIIAWSHCPHNHSRFGIISRPLSTHSYYSNAVPSVLPCPKQTTAVMWYVTGYGIAMGTDTYASTGNNGFIGTDSFLLTTGTFRGSGDDVGYNWAGWLFQWAFAATTATSESFLKFLEMYGTVLIMMDCYTVVAAPWVIWERRYFGYASRGRCGHSLEE